MWQISIIIFLIPFCVFAAIMMHDPRTLWSGASFFWMMVCLAFSAFHAICRSSIFLSDDLAGGWKFGEQYLRYSPLYYHQFLCNVCIIINGNVFALCNFESHPPKEEKECGLHYRTGGGNCRE